MDRSNLYGPGSFLTRPIPDRLRCAPSESGFGHPSIDRVQFRIGGGESGGDRGESGLGRIRTGIKYGYSACSFS